MAEAQIALQQVKVKVERERKNLKCAKGSTASGGNKTAAGGNETNSGASGQTADCSNDFGPASDVGVASEK